MTDPLVRASFLEQECKKSCPVVRMGKLCMEVEKTSPMVYISETLCIGCGICVKKVRL